VFPCDSLNPRVADDVLRIVNSKETKMEIARVQSRRPRNAQENDAGIQLPKPTQ
jgi:hypothetical protein